MSSNIPEVFFRTRQQKTFEFAILTNRELLREQLLRDHNPFRPHRIQFNAILYILKGTGHHFIDFKSYDYQRGSIIFISKEQVHRFEYNEAREAYFMIYTQEFLEKSSLGSNLMQQLSLFNYQLYHPVIQLREDQMGIFTELVKGVKEEYEAPDDVLTEEIIQSALRIFLCMAERIRKKTRSTPPHHQYHKEFLTFQQLLQKNLLRNRQVQFYADKMAISSKKLNRITQGVIQQPAKAYIHELLVLEMKRLLLNTSLSIKEIAFKSGFEDPTNFVKYFKKWAGMTPIAFRKSFKTSEWTGPQQ